MIPKQLAIGAGDQQIMEDDLLDHFDGLQITCLNESGLMFWMFEKCLENGTRFVGGRYRNSHAGQTQSSGSLGLVIWWEEKKTARGVR